ncbi:MAG: hypothetical protein U0625_04585 [Phycisphaerales bacterium]
MIETEVRRATHTPSTGSVAALALSAIALGFSIAAYVAATRAEDRAYARVVSEVGEAFRPIYRDFDLRYPTSEGPTLREILTPLFESVGDRSGASRGSDREVPRGP